MPVVSAIGELNYNVQTKLLRRPLWMGSGKSELMHKRCSGNERASGGGLVGNSYLT